MRTQHLRVTTVDDVRFQIEGNESAAIRVVDGVLMGPIGSGTVSLPLTDIAQVEVPERSGRRTAFFAGGVVAGIGLLLLLMTRAEVGQAPTIS